MNNETIKYNHAFTIAFSVGESDYEDGLDCVRYESHKVIHALLGRADDILRTPHELIEAVDLYDTYEEEVIT